MALKKSKKLQLTQHESKNYIKNDTLTYDSKIDEAEEFSTRSKELANEGIDFVTKGTVERSKAEKMLREGKALKEVAKELLNRSEENITTAAQHQTTGDAEKNDATEIQKRIDALNKEIVKLQKQFDTIWASGQKNIDKAEVLHAEGIDKQDRGNDILRKSEIMLLESEKLYKTGQTDIDKGNKLLDKSKETTNMPKKDIGVYTDEHFTGEIELDKIVTDEVEETTKTETK